MEEEKKRSLDISNAPSRANGSVEDTKVYVYDGDKPQDAEDFEVFKKTADGVDFRTVGWVKATVIFLKIIFATGVLSIPLAMHDLGAVGGALCVLAFGALNTYTAVIQGNFRNNHAHCHSIADMAEHVGGVALRELTGVMFIIAYILCTSSGIIGVATGINALSEHGACTVWFAFVATAVVIVAASVRKFEQISWLTWAGFISIFVAVLIIVVAVTTRDRPAAAPQTGPYELGYMAIAHPTFVAGITASVNIFVSSAGTSAFLPVISEMHNPRDYKKALFTCMGFVTAAYLSFSLVVYRWCGQWVASPSLGSAGQTIKKVSYGIGMIGLIVSACLYLHVAAKYVFVRILRNSRHLQHGTAIHWTTWLGCNVVLGAISFVISQGVPIFNNILALAGSICFAPLAIALPGWLWLFDYGSWRKGNAGQQVAYWFHWFLIVLGLFFLVGGAYGTIQQIIDEYNNGEIGSAFSCADNSGST
ncbi:transmembrane amino acid transporter protein-domain-containing protein [Phyllosticta citribraziliensis]|uniref:Transmembrane amino acid transporter protein-domain-containing protein n=1 Tax=Phyllosticta citribraziliensis TaxID=989973 RepID=A0ABR1LZ59_9PEZI